VLSPYGRVIQEDSIGFVTGSPATRIGHQGLFAERLDADTQQDPQESGSFIAWHNRNRTLLSEYGRFAQRDPFGSGQCVSYAGNEIIIPTLSLAPEPILMISGITNLYQYESSAPTELVDPSGLFGFLGGLGTGLDLADMSLGAMEQAYMGVSTGFGLGAMLQGYAFDQLLDADWAGDWNLYDTMYAQSGYSSSSTQAWASGFADPLFAMASISRLLRSDANLMPLKGHRKRSGGGHVRDYHEHVYETIDRFRRSAINPRTGEPVTGKAAEMKFKQAVESLKRDIKSVPDVLRRPGRRQSPIPWPGTK